MPPFTVYPNAIDSSTQLPITVDNITPVRGEVVNRQRDAIIAIESELGIEPSGTYATVRARLDALEALIGAGGSGGISAILDEGVVVRNNVKSLNFIGAGVSAIASGTPDRVNIIVSGGGGGGSILQKQEDIAVTLNGQVAFVVTETPIDSASVQMFVNGLKQEYGSDYTAVGKNVTYIGSESLITTDIVEFWYIYSGSGIVGLQTLSQTLALGNITGGTDIQLSNGDSITSAVGTVNIDDNINIVGDATITGKLTVAGLIDPTGLVLDEQATAPYDPTGQNTGLLWVNSNFTPNRIFYTNDAGSNLDLTAAISAVTKVIPFELTGIYSGAGVPGTFNPPYLFLDDYTIQSVSILRRNAGISGTTMVDVLKNGVSIFANDTVKPQVDFDDGDYAINTVSSFVNDSISTNDYIDIILETAEAGSAEDLIVLVRVV